MEFFDTQTHRRARLERFVVEVFGGRKVALGRALGYRDGAFVGQMLRGERKITEGTVEQVERLPGGARWFAVDAPVQAATPIQEAPAGRITIEQSVACIGAALYGADTLARKQALLVLEELTHHPEHASQLGHRLSATLALPAQTHAPAADSAKSRRHG